MWVIFEIGTGHFVRVVYKRKGGSDEVDMLCGPVHQRYCKDLANAWKFCTQDAATLACRPGEAVARVNVNMSVTT